MKFNGSFKRFAPVDPLRRDISLIFITRLRCVAKKGPAESVETDAGGKRATPRCRSEFFPGGGGGGGLCRINETVYIVFLIL